MKEDLGMSYRKVVGVSQHTNSERNRVLRQRFAMEFIRVLKEEKVVLNVDET